MTLHSSRPDARTDLLHGTLDMLILRTLLWGPQHGYALGQTIRANLAIAANERTAAGADRRSAQLASLKDFGNVALTTDAARRVWTPWWLEALHDQVSDVRYAVRVLLKGPAFALTVIAVLTLGI